MYEAATPLLTIVVDRLRNKEGLVQAHLLCLRLADGTRSLFQLGWPLDQSRLHSQSVETSRDVLFRKEVIQPQVLLRLPCYDFTPIMNYTLGGCFLAVSAPTSSATHFRDVTGGVYKARERIHRGMLIHDY